MNPLRHFLLALQTFTRVPVSGALGRWVGHAPADLRASVGHLPGAGALVGACSGALVLALAAALPAGPATPLVLAVLATAAGAWLTGAFHEDGLADVADGLGGSLERERALAIMKDPRIGSFGALALLLVVLAKVALLALLGGVDVRLLAVALFLGHVVSRLFPLLLIRVLPYVGDAARSRSAALATHIGPGALLVGVAWVVAAVLLGAWWHPGLPWWAGFGAAALAWAWSWHSFARRLQGITGDCLGATQQLCELAFLLGLACAL